MKKSIFRKSIYGLAVGFIAIPAVVCAATLHWTYESDIPVDGFRIYLDGQPAPVAELGPDARSWDFSEYVRYGETQRLGVSAFNAAGESAQAPPVIFSITAPAGDVPPAPSLLYYIGH